MKGRLIIIIGPSASGKTELVSELLKKVPDSARLVTITSKPPRQGENDYIFITRKEFEDRIAKGEFLEYAEVYGNLYGQSKDALEDLLRSYKYVFAILNVKGARVFKKMMPEALTVFIRAGSLEEIRTRIRKVRAGISQEELSKKIDTAAEELSQAETFDVVVENPTGRFPETVEAVLRLL